LVATIKETIEIEAPAERVWAVVHEDFKNAPKWSSNLKKVDVLTEGPTRKGTALRYHIHTPGGEQKLDVEHTTVTPGKTCAGHFTGGPLKGDWKYSYSERDGRTKLTYTMDYGPNGFAVRLFFGAIERQLPNDVRKTMTSLKKYVESGKGPRAKPAAKAPARSRATKS
jgi:uncharacterized membrane protein